MKYIAVALIFTLLFTLSSCGRALPDDASYNELSSAFENETNVSDVFSNIIDDESSLAPEASVSGCFEEMSMGINEESSAEPIDKELIKATMNRLKDEYEFFFTINGALFCFSEDLFFDILYPDGVSYGFPKLRYNPSSFNFFRVCGGIAETEDGSFMRVEFPAYKEFKITAFSPEKNELNKEKYMEQIADIYNSFHECVSAGDFAGMKQYVTDGLYEALLKQRDSGSFELCGSGYCIDEYFSCVVPDNYPEYVALQKMKLPPSDGLQESTVRSSLQWEEIIVDDTPGGHSQLVFSFEYYGDPPCPYWEVSDTVGNPDNGTIWHLDFVCDANGGFRLNHIWYSFHVA